MPEIRKAFHEEMHELEADVVRLAALATEAIEGGSRALLNFDLAAADRVIADDVVIDDLAHSIEDRTYLIMARQQPMATDLRTLVTVLRGIHELERIGDLTWTVTKRLHSSGADLLKEDSRDLSQMAETLEKMLDRIYRGFMDRDVNAASWVLQTDSTMNQTCRAIFHRHLESTDRRRRDYSTNLLFIAQAFERAGDHTKNLAEELFHLVEGRSVRHEVKRHNRDS